MLDVIRVVKFWLKGEDPFLLVKRHRRLWRRKNALQRPRKAKRILRGKEQTAKDMPNLRERFHSYN